MTRRTSRKRTSLRRNSYTATPAGKRVVFSFLDKRADSSPKLSTDGKRLDGLWMGGKGIAEWVNGKIVFHDLGSRSAQTVQRLIRRLSPAAWLRPNSRRSSLKRNTSLVKQGADASAMALIERAEHALGAGDYNVATIAFERLDAWKSRHGAWPFTAARYWRAVDEMQRGSQASLRRNSLRPPTWENYNEDTGVVLDRFSSRLDAVREAEDWRRSGFRVSSRKIGLRSNSRRRSSLRQNSADWSTRTAVAAKARAALARGDSRAAQRHLSELSTIDLAMMPRAVHRNGRRRRTSRR